MLSLLVTKPTPTPVPIPTVKVTVLLGPRSPLVHVVQLHDDFDLWSGLRIPIILGVLTLILTGLSLYIAWRAFVVSKRTSDREEERHDAQRRKERLAIKDDFRRWLIDEATLAPVSMRNPTFVTHLKTNNRVRQALESRGDKLGLGLRNWLAVQLSIRKQQAQGGEASPFTDDDAVFDGLDLISSWAENPASVSWVSSNDAIERRLGEHENARRQQADRDDTFVPTAP